MAAPKKHPYELMDRGVRLVFESGRPITHVARDLVAGTKEGDRHGRSHHRRCRSRADVSVLRRELQAQRGFWL